MAELMNDVAARGVNAVHACAVPDAFDGATGVAPSPRSVPDPDGTASEDGVRAAGGDRAADCGRANDGRRAADRPKPADGPVPARTDRPDVPTSLRAMIAQSVRDALGVSFAPDPSFDPAVSRLVSVAASMQRRHGHILLEAMALGLEAGGHVTVLREGPIRRIDVCPTARRVARRLDPADCAGIDLGYDAAPGNATDPSPGRGPRLIEVDAIVIDRRDGSALAIESKRGAKVGAPVLRQLIESTSVVSALLRAHLARHGQSVTTGDAVVLVQHADRGLVLPEGLGTTLAELDARYDGEAERMVAAATALHAMLVREALGELIERAAMEANGATGATEPRSTLRRHAATDPCGDNATRPRSRAVTSAPGDGVTRSCRHDATGPDAGVAERAA